MSKIFKFPENMRETDSFEAISGWSENTQPEENVRNFSPEQRTQILEQAEEHMALAEIFTERRDVKRTHQELTKAKDKFQQLIVADKNNEANYLILNRLGNACENMGSFDEAYNYYISSTWMAPAFKTAFLNLGQLCEKLAVSAAYNSDFKKSVHYANDAISSLQKYLDLSSNIQELPWQKAIKERIENLNILLHSTMAESEPELQKAA